VGGKKVFQGKKNRETGGGHWGNGVFVTKKSKSKLEAPRRKKKVGGLEREKRGGGGRKMKLVDFNNLWAQPAKTGTV